jgi:hypothetical protein
MLALTSPTSGGLSVGIVRSGTQATEFVGFFLCMKLGNRLQIKCDSEQNTVWNIIFSSKIMLCKCVEIMQCNTENHEGALSHCRSEAEIGHSYTQAMIY